MKILKLKRVGLIVCALLVSAPLCAAWLYKTQAVVTAQIDGAIFSSKPPFVVRNYGGKCMEYGVPVSPIDTIFTSVPVFISDCNGTTVQKIRVQELNGPGHLVILLVGDRVIGKKLNSGPVMDQVDLAPSGAGAAAQLTLEARSFTSESDQIPLEAQPYSGTPGPGQIFALDGDSIILAADRNLVVEVQNGRGANRTPLVLGRRDLDDSEFWTFTAANGSNWRPTTGFRRVPSDQDPNNDAFDFAQAVRTAEPGAVIEVPPDASIDLTDQGTILIRTGVTIRGDRRGLRPGPELWVREGYEGNMLEIDGSDVRITGLRMRGPTRSTDKNSLFATGIMFDRLWTQFHRSIVDHNDMSGWTVAAVKVHGTDSGAECQAGGGDPKSHPENVRVARNFLHHNRRQNEGYGVETKHGAKTLIDGNTFVSNRHAIAAGGQARTIYRAWNNLVLSDAPLQERFWVFDDYTHDFDMHGTKDLFFTISVLGGTIKQVRVAGFGGTGGEYVEIARNTFLGTNRKNFNLRGEPCFLAEFHQNISLRSLGDAISCGTVEALNQSVNLCGGGINKLKVSDTNQFNAANPTNNLGVGDFDGDGLDDLFLATGAAWYYAPAANAEWRFINAKSEKIDKLLFGDFDVDGRTDVFTLHGANWDVSWGGASRWEKINQGAAPMNDFAVGDFIGDKRADVFFANGVEWFFSDGGVGPLTPLNTSGFRVADVRFGDFNADGKTDVFSVVSGNWAVSFSGTSVWTPLRPKLSDSVSGLAIADFNGDGRSDVATISCQGVGLCDWKVSWSGVEDWATLRSVGPPSISLVAIGRFDGDAKADVLSWNSENLYISSAGSGTPERQSAQDMR